ncbi:hypothetical protein [Legionella israelensis]|uniref:Uncharacterized protein n=1 Tax=Legionella israelensis TaxID=454 RepID=A0A0W0V4A4_9GAMM|nr:hypothetical protein [Legionella israelensis]KTD14967.1 hypothetical protein Lisr_2312 [Legionella israelensis]QBS10034.1 hypothetical protein E4T55_09315 [Legionella israelensis]SCX78535.1 hypothetical protein SAMN02746069_00176 [Legionella israelensis DSM 19235]STX59617.1 Uncharacterised protein [Legionella israelensis]
MINPDILIREIETLLCSINDRFHQDNGRDFSWENRRNGQGELSQMVSELMTKKQAKLIYDELSKVLPAAVSVVKSRRAEGESSYRVMISLKKCQKDLTESIYINSFLNSVRKFPSVHWSHTEEGNIKAIYPIQCKQYYKLLCQALNEFNSGINVECFEYSKNENGELVVIGHIDNIRTVIDHHKIQCLNILEKYLKDVEGISNVTLYADVERFNSYYAYLIVNNAHDSGLPGLTFQVKDTKSYEQAKICFPDIIECKPNGYINSDGDENTNREIGVKVRYMDDMAYLLTRKLYQNIHEARSDFCEQLWALKTKGSFYASNLRFFPQDITRYIYKNVCSDNAYLTQDEIMDAILKIEANSLSEEMKTYTSNGFVGSLN